MGLHVQVIDGIKTSRCMFFFSIYLYFLLLP